MFHDLLKKLFTKVSPVLICLVMFVSASWPALGAEGSKTYGKNEVFVLAGDEFIFKEALPLPAYDGKSQKGYGLVFWKKTTWYSASSASSADNPEDPEVILVYTVENSQNPIRVMIVTLADGTICTAVNIAGQVSSQDYKQEVTFVFQIDQDQDQDWPGSAYVLSEVIGGSQKDRIEILINDNANDSMGSQAAPANIVTPYTQSLAAVPTSSAVLVNGKNIGFDAYNIDGSNYFKLRDIAYALNGTAKQFDVAWDGADNAILLLRDKPYAITGGEMTGQGIVVKTALPTNSKILLDGRETSFTAYNIENSNYFKLRDIGKTFDFNVSWDTANNAILINSVESYAEDGAAAFVPMTVTCAGVINGGLDDRYGMRGQQQDGVPTRSLPLSIKNAPDETVCYAVIMIDPDSKPLCGYEWTHWLAANITTAEIAENASIDSAAGMAQGKNDFDTTGYGGPTPPDKPHTYKISVYALDAELDLKNGYSKDQLLEAINSHALAEASFEAKYSN